MEIETIGWSEPFVNAFEDIRSEFESATPARVIGAQRERYRLLTSSGAFDAQPSGRLRHEAREGELPVVGDWVAALLRHDQASATIVATLPRTKSAGATRKRWRHIARTTAACSAHATARIARIPRSASPEKRDRGES